MKKLSVFLFAALAVSSVWAGRGDPGLYQKIYSGANVTTGDPEDGGVVIAAGAGLLAVKSGNPSISYTDPETSTTYTLGGNQTVAYKGVMNLEAGKTYTFVKSFDDRGVVRIITPDGSVTNQIINSGVWDDTAYGSFAPKETGYHTLLIYFGNGSSGVGPAKEPFKSEPYASIMWNDVGLKECNADNKSQWHRLINGEDGLGTYLFTALPIICSYELTRTSDTSYGIVLFNEGLEISVKAVATDANGSRIATSTEVLAEGGQTELNLSDLDPDTSYDITLEMELGGEKRTQKVACVFTGEVSIESSKDADEASGAPGFFTVSLSGEAVAASDFAVSYAVNDGSTAVAGQTYVALPGKVTIPAGANSATIRVVPMVDKSVTEDTGLCLDLVESTAYAVSESAASATVQIKNGEFTGWMYDAALGEISNGDWTFKASVKANTTELTVNAVQSDPGEGATLDFSKSIMDSASTVYTLVALNPNFSAYDNRTNLVALVLPETGLTTISANAFKNCTSLTSITPFLPDSVTTLGGSAFYAVPVEAPVVMMGVTSVPNGTFQYSGITEATFGPNLKTISGGWVSGSFDHCSNLAKLNFDPNMSGAAISGSDEFAYCSKLSGTVDLSGFTSLSGRIFYTYGGSISKLILSSDLASADPGVFDYLNTLKSVEFTAGVPKDKNFYKMYNNTSRVTLSSVITTVKEEYKDEWAAYCEGGSINKIDSLWRLDLVPSAATKGFYLVYKGQGGGGELGDWIFNGETVTNVTYGWGFAATTAGQLLFLGNCTQYPEEPSPLDFTTRITDEDGNEMGISTYAKLFHNGTDNTPSLPGAEKVLSVVLPLNCPIVGNNAFRGCTNMVSATLHDKISKIEANAFRDCKALMTVTPCLPDSLTELGSCAFMQCALGFDCRLAGVSTIGSSAIRATQLRSLFVGKTVKTIGGGYTNGGISYNTELTNLTFEAGVTNATLQGEHTLCNNTKLGGSVDLSGFSSIGGGRPLDGAKITNLTFSAQLASIPGAVLEGLSRLQNLYFLGPPPTNVGLIFDQQGRVARIGKNQDVRTYVYRAYADQWKVYAKDEVLDGKHSTWSPEYLADEVTDLSKRKLLLVDPPPGLMVIVK